MNLHALATLAALSLWALPSKAQETPQAPADAPAAGAAAVTETATTLVVLPSPAPERSNRELGGHLFLPSHLIVDPFSCTSFGSYFGVGAGQALGPVFDPGPPPTVTNTSKWYGYTGLAQEFDLNVRILEYLSARLYLGAGAYQGTGSGSALVVGTNVRMFGDLEVKGSLPLGRHVRLALSAGAAYGPVFNILLLDAVKEALDACRADPAACTIDPGKLLQVSDTVTWKGLLSAAWGPWPWLGFQANVEYLNPQKTGRASYSQNGLRVGGSVDFDAKPLVSWLPVGVNFVYTIVGPIGGNGVTTTQNTGVGLFYTGRRDLALGLEIDWQQGRIQSNLASETTLAWVDFRYYW